MGIVLFFLIFCLIVIVHEFGHFIIARMNHIKVNEFSIGMGPALFSFTKGGVKYAVRLLPLGGACMFEGEDGKYTKDDEVSKDAAEKEEFKEASDEDESGFARDSKLGKKQYAFPEAPVWGRIATVFAGPFFNFVLAFLFSVIIIGSYGTDMPVVVKLAEGGAAMEAGLKEGDVIVKLDKKNIHLYREISLYSMLNRGEPMQITYLRDGVRDTVTLQPKFDSNAGRYYMGILGRGEYRKLSAIDTVRYGVYEVGYWIDTVIKSLELIFRGEISKDDVAGPVGMAQMVNVVYVESKPDGLYYVWLNMVNFCILLSANLGVMNLLPLPALDGGRLVFLFLEVIRGKPIPPEKEGFVHMIGMVALMALMVFIFYNDLTRIF